MNDGRQKQISFVRISTLRLAAIFLDFVLFPMQDYLTSVWNLEVTHAAGILNITGFLSGVLPIPFLFFTLKCLGNFTTLVISSFAYVVGIGFIFLSTPPILAGATHTCKTYQESCIGPVQKDLFLIGMGGIAIGVAAQSVSIEAVLREQGVPKARLRGPWGANIPVPKILGLGAVAVVGIVGAIGFPYVKPWSLRFLFPTIITFLVAALFLSGCRSYNKPGPEGNPGTAGDEKWIFIRMGATWFAVFFCGIVSSTGNTYFVEQASNMNHHHLPLQFLLLINGIVKTLVKWIIEDRFLHRGGVAIAIILSILCCIAAAIFETMRLDVIRKHGLEDKPNDTIPMSMFLLLPQFILLAGLDILLEKSVSDIYKEKIPEPRYLNYATNAAIGFGMFGAVGLVYIVDTVTEKMGSKKSWFQRTLNKSRLDKYYWGLAVLSTANLLFWSIVVALTCSREPPETNGDEEADRVEGRAASRFIELARLDRA